MCLRTLVWATLVLAVVPAANSQARYTITDLGTLGGSSSGTAINNAGQVTGWFQQGSGLRVFLYSDDVMTDLGQTYNFLGDLSHSPSINDAGQVAFTTVDSSGYAAVLYSDSTITRLGDLGGGSSFSAGINVHGQITGCSATDDLNKASHAFLYSNGNMTDLGVIPSLNNYPYGNTSCGNAVNASGEVAGYSLVGTPGGSFYSHAFLYSDGTMADLGRGSFEAINDSGHMAGSLSSAGQNAVLYDHGNVTSLGNIGGTFSTALAINNADQVVGYADTSGCQGCLHAVLYTPDNGMIDLNTTLPAGSGWQLEVATGINTYGQITGRGVNPQGVRHAFLLTPILVVSIATSGTPSVYGNTVTLAATVAPFAPSSTSPTGSVRFKDGGVSLGPAISLDDSGRAEFSTSSLTAGSHPITAEYGGNSDFPPGISPRLNQVVSPAALTVVTNSKTRTYGIDNPALDGSVAGLVNNDPISVTYSTTATRTSDVGEYPITATLNDPENRLNNYTVENPGGTLTIVPAASQISVTSSANLPHFGEAVTFTARVGSSVGTPAGTIMFLDGATELGSVPLAAGAASLSTTSLSVGAHSITAVYRGSTNFTGSTSAELAQTIIPPKITIAGSGDSATMHTGQQINLQLSVSSLGLVTAPITLSCAGLPSGANCAFVPASLDATHLPADIDVTISTTRFRIIGSNHVRGNIVTWAMLLPCLVLLRVSRLKKCKFIAVSCLLLLLALGLSACGGSGAGDITNVRQSSMPGTYSVSVTAVANGATAGTWNTQLVVTR